MVFLEIHTFQDGNGRLSWVLTTLLLIQAGYAYVPPMACILFTVAQQYLVQLLDVVLVERDILP